MHVLKGASQLRLRVAYAVILAPCCALLGGCGSLSSVSSPDVVYANNADEAKALQVPPDLTDVSNAEQFVLPGTGNSTVARNTLLPQFDGMRFVREGGQSWLEFQQAPEDLWPQLLAFARQEKYRIEQTEPVAGVIVTQWRAAGAQADSGILKNLVSNDEEYTRVGFRLERAAGGTRLFARSQAASEAAVKAASASNNEWPASSHNPEKTSALLNRFLVFLGVEQQKARGILGEAQARAVLDDAVVQRNAAGSEMIVNSGFQTSFRQVLNALKVLDYNVISSDDNVGRIEFTDKQAPRVLQLAPVHVSAVRVSVRELQGGKIPADEEQQLLDTLAKQIS